ncbi:MAG: hypothetical protein J3K34DRAFT_134872 [Monoraphidium minutum]|nr:MAG: hypothetical protein J3K34DRAFT_134872 [Monoraphidium minutum]
MQAPTPLVPPKAAIPAPLSKVTRPALGWLCAAARPPMGHTMHARHCCLHPVRLGTGALAAPRGGAAQPTNAGPTCAWRRPHTGAAHVGSRMRESLELPHTPGGLGSPARPQTQSPAPRRIPLRRPAPPRPPLVLPLGAALQRSRPLPPRPPGGPPQTLAARARVASAMVTGLRTRRRAG